MAEGGNHRLEIAMGNLLRVGVTIAAAVVLVGGILYLVRAPGAPPSYGQFHGAPVAFESVRGIVAGAWQLNAESLIALGILLLIATPICRVLMGAMGFLMEKDRFYAAVSTVVLLILLISFFTGR